MAAIFRNECGQQDCLCTFLLLDLDLAKEWLSSCRDFMTSAIASLRSIKPKVLFMPWRLTSLAEHEECFQQWCILQMLVGVVATFFVFLLTVIWSATTEDTVKMSIGSIITNTLLRLLMSVLATWIVWFGVSIKRGCCCAIFCCCIGKPNILVVAIVEGIFALVTLIFIIQALGFGHVLLILSALVALVHLVTQVYLTIEAFMVWLRNRSDSTAGTHVVKVGPPVKVGQGAPIAVKKAWDGVMPGGSTTIEDKVEEIEDVHEV
jgi:hypothetical protein